MENQSHEVKLEGAWHCGHTTRVQLALKIKGVPFQYAEVDLTDKGDSLFQYGSVSKKVPVLIHHGKPITDSLITLEYVDEIWNHTPKFLPEDPFQKAQVRNWANYYDKQVNPLTYKIMTSKCKEREKTIKELNQVLQVFEQGVEREFPKKSPFINGDTLGFLEIVVGSSACNYKAFNEKFGVIFDPKKNPAFMTWVVAMEESPVMKEILPPPDRLVAEMIKVLEHPPKTKFCGKNYLTSTISYVAKMCLELALVAFCTSCEDGENGEGE